MFLRKRRVLPAPAVTFDPAAGLNLEDASVTGSAGAQNITILNRVSVQLRAQRTAVLGLNGSGKSTFLKLFNGLVQPDSGHVRVGGIEVGSHLRQVRQKVGLLFADPQAQLIMPTPVEDVELSLQHSTARVKSRREKALELLTEQGLKDRAESSVYDISGGERQLTALTALLAVEPQVLLLDEPTTLLDLRNKLRLMTLLDRLPQQLLISTHDLELAASCTEAVVIHRGQVIAHGESPDIIGLYKHWCATHFPDTQPSTDEGQYRAQPAL